MIISICALSVPAGNLLAFLQTGLLWRGVTTLSPDSLIDSTMNKMIWQQCYLVTFIAVGFMLVIRSEPEHAPSLVSLKAPKQQNLGATLIKVIKNRDFMFLLVAFALLDGTFIGFGSVLSVIFEPEGFTSS